MHCSLVKSILRILVDVLSLPVISESLPFSAEVPCPYWPLYGDPHYYIVHETSDIMECPMGEVFVRDDICDCVRGT